MGAVICDRDDRVSGLVGGFRGVAKDRGHVNGLVGGKIVVWILVILHDFYPVIDFDFINRGHHSWSVVREVIEGGILGRRINGVVFAGLNNLNDMVVARLLQLQVNIRNFSRDAGVGICVRFDKAFIVVEIIVVPII